MTTLPDVFEIVCRKGHDRQVVYTRQVNLAERVMRTNRKSFAPGEDAPWKFDRLDSTELRCPDPNCARTLRITDADLGRVIVACCDKGVLDPELSGIGGILRAIR